LNWNGSSAVFYVLQKSKSSWDAKTCTRSLQYIFNNAIVYCVNNSIRSFLQCILSASNSLSEL
jgi:hypothetical protein